MKISNLFVNKRIEASLAIAVSLVMLGCATLFKTTEPINYALPQYGTTATASATNPGRDISSVINGVKSSDNWDEGEGWEAQFTRRIPDNVGWTRLDPKSNMEYGCAWIEINLKSEKLINRIVVYTLDSSKYPASRYGIKEAWIQVWKDYGWVNVGEIENGYIVSKTDLSRKPAGGVITVKFAPVKTDKIRLVVFRSNDVNMVGEGWSSDRKSEISTARVIEIEVFGLESEVKSPPKEDRWVKEAPGFYLQDVNGQWLKLSDLKGDIIVMTFWATWSSESVSQLMGLRNIDHQYAEQGVTVLGISVDEGGAERIKGFVQSNQLAFPILIADTSVKSAYGGIGKLPSTFIIDRKGNIYKEYFGYRDATLIEVDVKNLLSQDK